MHGFTITAIFQAMQFLASVTFVYLVVRMGAEKNAIA